MSLLFLPTAKVVLNWVSRFGGFGLVPLGIVDHSPIPVSGSMDILTIWLAAAHPRWWPYYAAMATIGSLAGGFITYSLARKGAMPAMRKKLRGARAMALRQKFEEKGFAAIAISALLPPPFPFIPILLVAGATQYSRKRFLGALATGRGLRFSLVAGLGALYGNYVIAFFGRYYGAMIFAVIVLTAWSAGWVFFRLYGPDPHPPTISNA